MYVCVILDHLRMEEVSYAGFGRIVRSIWASVGNAMWCVIGRNEER